MADLTGIARRLGGDVVGGRVLCPGPGHSAKDRSLSVYLDWQAPDGFRVHSFANDAFQDCRDHVRERLGLRDFQAQHSFRAADAKPGHSTTSIDRTAFAARIVSESRPVAGTIAERYLVNRVGTTMIWPDALRFHPRCPRGRDRLPALICVLTDAATNEFKAIQRIFLQPDGTDRLRDDRGKMTLGAATGAVCKLSPDEDVTLGLGLTEGVEKGLALIALGWRPIWVSCGTSTMANFALLAGIDALTVFADPDDAGQTAAEACGKRWGDAGREIIIRTPRASADWDKSLTAGGQNAGTS